MGSKSNSPPAPDYGPIAASTNHAADLGYQAANEDLAFRKQVYNEQQPRINQLQDLATQVTNQQMGIAGENQDRANQQWNYWQNTFQPTEKAMNMDAYQAQYLSPEERAAMQANPDQAYQYGQTAADRASQERVGNLQGLQDQQLGFLSGREAQDREAMQAQIAGAYGDQDRNLARYGMGDANRSAALATQSANQQSLARVAGLNALSQGYGAMQQGVRQNYGQQIADTKANRYATGTSLRAGSAAFGRNMPNTAGQAYGLATQAGNSAVANQNTGNLASLPFAQFQAGGYGTQLGAAGLGSQAALGLGGLQNQGYGIQAGMYNAQQGMQGAGLAGLGQLGGSLFGSGGAGTQWLQSDRRLKEDVVRVGSHPLGVGVYEYTIGGRRERGVMADEVEKVRPKAVRVGPDGFKQVNYAMLGVRHGS